MATPQSWAKPSAARRHALQQFRDAMRRAESGNVPATADAQSWQTAMEELSVAEEELRQQNDELVALTAELEAEQRQYYRLFNLAPDCYLVTDAYGVIREANLAAA